MLAWDSGETLVIKTHGFTTGRVGHLITNKYQIIHELFRGLNLPWNMSSTWYITTWTSWGARSYFSSGTLLTWSSAIGTWTLGGTRDMQGLECSKYAWLSVIWSPSVSSVIIFFVILSKPTKFYLQGIGWNKFVDVKLKFWRYFYKMWVEDRPKKDLKIVFYEDLKTNLSRIAKDINSFIGLPFNPERLDCVMRVKNKLFKRQVLNPDHSGYFSYWSFGRGVQNNSIFFSCCVDSCQGRFQIS